MTINSLQEENLIFIGGSPRSGTTLVQRILGQHADIYAGPEFDMVPMITSLYKDHLLQINSGRIDKILTHERARVAFSQLIISLFNGKAQQEKAKIFCEKTPSNALVFSDITALLPSSKLIMVTRNPNDIYLSMQTVRKKNLSHGIELSKPLKNNVAMIRTIGEHQTSGLATALTSTNAFCIQYEDIINQPEQTIKSLCAFLKIDFQQGLLELEGKKMDTAPDELKIWYSEQEISRGLDKPKIKEPLKLSGFEKYLFSKYIPLDKPPLEQFKHQYTYNKALQPIYFMREYFMSNKRHRRRLRNEAKNKQ